ncbi:MAG: response regulator [Chitinivibrionales bacterium]|nr:response regulator [Chitinivibrionales bacterium]MBD3358912.1 response regulator [Chitinivibrionales bacterium]
MIGNDTRAPLTPRQPILLLDDDLNALRLMDMTLRVAGFTNIILFKEGSKALAWLKDNEVELAVLDILMPEPDGASILEHLKTTQPDTPVIMATGVNEIDTAVHCIKNGAFDYLVKPLESERFIAGVTNAVKMRQLQRENALLSQTVLKPTLRNPDVFAAIRTRCPSMLAAFHYIEAVALTPHAVLITGETGTGKELVARAIHAASGRKGELVAVNAAGLDDYTFTDTLFGHRKGAYTGADAERPGLVQTAVNGTLFLDEIGDLNPQSQTKLLRLMQEFEYFPLGADHPKRCSCRIVAATNKNIKELAELESFRNDLYYRLKTHHISLPPLRERKKDIPLLIDGFLEDAAREQNRKKPTYPPELIDLLKTYSFPGNIRELQAMVRDAFAMHKDGTLLSTASFRAMVSPNAENHSRKPVPRHQHLVTFHDRLPTLEQVQDAVVREALDRSSGNQSVAAALLGITRQSLSYRLKKQKQS